jgi:hypothetical protein
VTVACKSKNGDSTALLLSKGADHNLINNLGEDALHVAGGDAETAIKTFREGDLIHFKKSFPVVAPYIGMLPYLTTCHLWAVEDFLLTLVALLFPLPNFCLRKGTFP